MPYKRMNRYPHREWVLRYARCVRGVLRQGAPTRLGGFYGEETQCRRRTPGTCVAAENAFVMSIYSRPAQAIPGSEQIFIEQRKVQRTARSF